MILMFDKLWLLVLDDKLKEPLINWKSTPWSAAAWLRFGQSRTVATKSEFRHLEECGIKPLGPKRRQAAALQGVEHLIRTS
jgi:hypothetical protein